MQTPSITFDKTSDDELWSQTIAVARKEQRTTLELLYHLHEVERRRLHLEWGYSSLWDYTQRVLGYSESQTAERISAMRLMFRLPAAREAIESGSLGITQAAMTERHLRAEEKEKKAPLPPDEVRSLLSEVQGKSTRETVKTLLAHRPKEVVPERIQQRTAYESEVRFMASEETRAAMERYWELSGRTSIGELVATCLASYLDNHDPSRRKAIRKTRAVGGKASRDLLGPGKLSPSPARTLALKSQARAETLSIKSTESAQSPVPHGESPPPKLSPPRKSSPRKPSRYIPAAVRREILERSRGECEYEDPMTHQRCRSRYRVEFDHVEPYALGGASDAGNLRLLCRAHNAHLAENLFSKNAFDGFFRSTNEMRAESGAPQRSRREESSRDLPNPGNFHL